ERSFGSHLPEFDMTLKDDFGVRGNFKIDCLARDQLDWIVPQEARKKKFVHIGRHRQNSAKARRRVRTDRDGNLEPSALLSGTRAPEMFGAVLLGLPVHSRGSLVE